MLSQNKLLETGVPARAVILDIEPTGTTLNDQPEVRLVLEVRPDNGTAYQAELKTVINPVYLPQFQPGAKLNVKYDPNDQSKVAVESVVKTRR